MNPPDRRRGRRTFLIVAALFFAPVLGAIALYFWFPALAPDARTNYGELLLPPPTLPADATLVAADGSDRSAALRGKWTLVVHTPGACEAVCIENLVLARQVRLSLNDKRTRVQRLLLTDEAHATALAGALAAEHPDLLVAVPGASLARMLPPDSEVITLLDPLGNAVLRYRPRHDADGIREAFAGMRKEIKKLLRLSRIG